MPLIGRSVIAGIHSGGPHKARSRVIFGSESGKVDRFTIRRGARELPATRIVQ